MTTMSNLEQMLHSHDPETVRLALTAMGYKENQDSFDTVSYQLRLNFGLLLYVIYGSENYCFDNLSLYNFGNNQDTRLKL